VDRPQPFAAGQPAGQRPISTYCDGKLGWFSSRGAPAIKGVTLREMRNEVFHVYFSLLLAGAAGANVVAVDDRTVEISAGDGIVAW